MMDALRVLADRLDETAAALAGIRPEEGDPGTEVWGNDPVGGLGEVTEALRTQLIAALHARGREAAAAATRISALAADVRVVADGYRDVDQAARRRTLGTQQEAR